jgi:hypothetical protein
MNLLELLKFYQLSLRDGCPRAEMLRELREMGVDESVIEAIVASFNDTGEALHAIPREDDRGQVVMPFVEDDGFGGFQFVFEEVGAYVLEE